MVIPKGGRLLEKSKIFDGASEKFVGEFVTGKMI
jgi:hypothetical protein